MRNLLMLSTPLALGAAPALAREPVAEPQGGR